jgi:transaldolase/glucose-6-phosphate isomerase
LLELAHPSDVSRHFAAQTEPNSFLSSLSRGYTFRASFLDPPQVLSSYCSLIHFGALLVALSKLDDQDALSSARAMRQLCSTDSSSNPALQLAVFLATAALAPCSYLVFLSSPSLAPYSSRLGHLVAGSLAHEGSKLIPITGQVPPLTDGFQKNAAFVFLTLHGEGVLELFEKMDGFRISGVPFVHIELPGAAELLPESFKWEIAAALACITLGLNPFDWPDVRYPRRIAMELLDKLSVDPGALARTPRLQESGIQLFAEARTRSEISTLNLVESFRSFFRLNEPQRFLALLVFLDRAPAVESALYEIRTQLTRQLGIPVVLSSGPRCFDQYAYLCLTGASEAMFIVLTADYPSDFSIPGALYTFSQLHSALCLGEFESIVHSDRLTIRINLTGDLAEALANLELAFAKALSHPH